MMPLMPSSTNASEMKREGIFHSIMPSEKYELMDGCGLIPLSKKC